MEKLVADAYPVLLTFLLPLMVMLITMMNSLTLCYVSMIHNRDSRSRRTKVAEEKFFARVLRTRRLCNNGNFYFLDVLRLGSCLTSPNYNPNPWGAEICELCVHFKHRSAKNANPTQTPTLALALALPLPLRATS